MESEKCLLPDIQFLKMPHHGKGLSRVGSSGLPHPQGQMLVKMQKAPLMGEVWKEELLKKRTPETRY
jgi:hypothetical protein